MKHINFVRRLASLALALVLAASLAPAALAAGGLSKEREYPGFSDVQESDWFYTDVRGAYELGLINGSGEGIFNPKGQLTLAEAITMAVNVCAKYYGDNFTPGGSPWYTNAVTYAEEVNIISSGMYSDFNKPATRSDVARMFANSLNGSDLGRINRIAWIPDVNPATPYWEYIYVLYNAGVLAGDASGNFRPDDTITRAEAAAILNRVALPEKRLNYSLTTKAPGQLLQSADGSFTLNVPQNPAWTTQNNGIEDEGHCSVYLAMSDGTATFQVDAFSKSVYKSSDLAAIAQGDAEYLEQEWEMHGVIDEDGIYGSWTRGLDGYSFDYTWTTESGYEVTGRYSCVENGEYFFTIWQEYLSDCSDETYYGLKSLLMSFDMAV